jgi:hypothetical protein
MFISHLENPMTHDDKTQYRTTRQRNCTPGGLFFMRLHTTLKHASATTSSPSPLYCTLCLTSRLVRARPKGNLTTLARRHHSIHVGALLMRPLSLATDASDGSASEGRLREWQLVVAAAAAFAAFAFAFASAAAATLCVQRRVVPDLERFSVLDPFWGCECRTWENT